MLKRVLAGLMLVVLVGGTAVAGRFEDTSQPLMVSFTGSTRVGKATMASAASDLKKVSMELGGKNPQIVFPDADLDAALDAVLFGAYFNAGGCCNAGSRLIVHRSIAEDFIAAVRRRAADVPIGDPLDPSTKVGAIITPEHLGKIENYLAGAMHEGATLETGGGRLAGQGQFLEATVVSGVAPTRRLPARRSSARFWRCSHSTPPARRSSSPMPPTTGFQPQFGVAISTLASALAAVFAPARSG